MTCDECKGVLGHTRMCSKFCGTAPTEPTPIFTAAVAAAVAQERERCAKLCDEARAAVWPYHDPAVKKTAETVCENLAARIRATPTEPSK